MKNLVILGSTGSIGTQALEVVSEHKEDLRVLALAAHKNTALLEEQIRAYRPAYCALFDGDAARDLSVRVKDLPVRVLSGMEGLIELASLQDADIVLTSLVGMIGIRPTIAAIEAGKDVALANKETLVVAGELINRMLESSASVIYPVDSEHGAFYQCLVGEDMNNVSKLILTASGGPFRTMSKEQLATVTKADALRHPNWSMGAKITIDSATMMNKGFEMIEAKWLYGTSQERIEIVVHPQSIVHSMVEFVDGSVKAQLGMPDMHLPIRYALGLPGRLASDSHRMTIADYANLTFEKPDFDKFPLLTTAYDAARRGGNAPCVMNAANEIAVAAFLHDKIGFNDIFNIIERTMAWAPFIAQPGYDDYVATNAQSRAYAESLI